MALNISNLIDILNAKLAAANSSTSAVEAERLSFVSDYINDSRNALLYSSNTVFPTANVSNAGTIALDSSSNTYYYSTGSAWTELNATSMGGGGASGTQAQGSNYGYTSGGFIPTTFNTIDKFPFATDGNATDVGDLNNTTSGAAGQSSTDYGYTSGGKTNVPTTTILNNIQKFPFAADGNASDVGDLTAARYCPTGQSSTDYGYTSGGRDPGVSFYNIIDKFSFAADGNASDVGNLSQSRDRTAGQSSTDYGYTSGGRIPASTNTIDKFPFSADGNATDVGDLTTTRYFTSGQSSSDYGYSSGGTPTLNVIDKFPFSSDANATDVGDLTAGRYGTAGQSSTDYGYVSSGAMPGSGGQTTIEKFPFASDGNAADVGDVTLARYYPVGQQY